MNIRNANLLERKCMYKITKLMNPLHFTIFTGNRIGETFNGHSSFFTIYNTFFASFLHTKPKFFVLIAMVSFVFRICLLK